MLGFDLDGETLNECRAYCEARGLGQDRSKALASVLKSNGGEYGVGPMFRLFEMMSRMLDYDLGLRIERDFTGLSMHPIFRKGRFAVWEILDRSNKVGSCEFDELRPT